jgi:hypothetical protein
MLLDFMMMKWGSVDDDGHHQHHELCNVIFLLLLFLGVGLD